MKDNLKSCPFCGGEATEWTEVSVDYPYQILCKSCFCGTDTFTELEDAVKAWNTRKPMDKIVEELTQDEKKLAHYEDLEEAGRLITLPCAIGDDIFQVPSKVNFDLNILNGREENNRVYHQKAVDIVTKKSGWFVTGDKDKEYGTGRLFLDVSFGETWFLTKAEAEAKLAELKGE